MPLDFPSNPNINDTYTQGSSTWIFDGSVWNVSNVSDPITNFNTIVVAGQDSVVADSLSDTLNLVAGSNVTITTNAGTDSITIASSAASNTFGTIAVSGQDSLNADNSNDTLTFVAGTGISLTTDNTSDSLTINATTNVTSINNLSDVDTSSTPPTTGQVLKWNGTNWAPGVDATTGGAGTDADTLDGFDSAYFLNYNNLSNKPTIPSAIFQSIEVAGQNTILADSQTDTLTVVAGTGISITTDAITDTLTITNTSAGATYSLSAENVTGGANLRLTGSDASTDDIKFAAGSNITVTRTDANTITIASTGISGGNSFETISVAGQNNVVAESSTDTLTLAAGTGISITTDETTDTITITNSSPAVSQNVFSTIAVSGQTSVVADSSTDTLTFAAGTGISITTNAETDTITLTNTVTAITNFSALTDASTSSLTVDKFYLPAITALNVTNSGAIAYLFDQYSGNNPQIYAINGTTIAFRLNVTGHPFLIQDNTGNNYSIGLVHVSADGTVVTGASAQGQTSGTLYWKVPTSISGNYRYQCSIHGAMVGTITIKAIASI